MRRIVGAIGVVVAVLAASCAGGDVTLEEPIPTLFPPELAVADDSDGPASTTEDTATTTTAPIAPRLPPLADDVDGAVRSDAGALLAIEGSDGETWTVAGPCTGSVEVEAATATVVGPQHVVLDPGHGGADRGVAGPGGLDEADLNLDIARRARAALEAHGVRVVLTRDADVELAAATRAAAAGAVGAAAMVSVHHGEIGSPAAGGPGSEAWYQIDDPASRRLAGLVYEEITTVLDAFDVRWWAPPEPGVKYLLNQRGDDYHTVLRESAGTPAVLAELAVLANPAEAELLAGDEGRQAEAEALARAVIRFLVDDDEGRGFIEPTERVRTAAPAGTAGCS